MRLIDADKLQKAVQKAMEEYDGYSPYDRLKLSGLIVADDLIDDAPTVEEAVIPVLCRDCKHSTEMNGWRECEYRVHVNLPDEWCNYGERRESDGSNQETR